MSRTSKRKSITQAIMDEVVESQRNREHDLTRKQYIRDCKRFVVYCREHHPECKTLRECKAHLQEYANYLYEQEYASSTIHTYVAAACSVLGIPMDAIQKPKRHVSEYMRGRTAPFCPTKRKDINHPEWERLIAFQRCLGLRRREIFALRAEDCGYDETGHFCVVVRRSKGGKRQLQRVYPESAVPMIRSYFEEALPGNRLFSEKRYQRQQLNLHALRAEQAKRVYFDLEKKIRQEPGYAAVLEREIRARWQMYNIDKRTGKSKKFNESLIRGDYVLRGANRELAKQKNLPGKYNKLCLMYVSIFHLAHWRTGVTVASYILA